jgi:hypothetical protein
LHRVGGLHRQLADFNRLSHRGVSIATVEFESFRLLQVAIIKDRGKKFIVEPPSRVSAAARVTLLDLRAQGFDIALRSAR